MQFNSATNAEYLTGRQSTSVNYFVYAIFSAEFMAARRAKCRQQIYFQACTRSYARRAVLCAITHIDVDTHTHTRANTHTQRGNHPRKRPFAIRQMVLIAPLRAYSSFFLFNISAGDLSNAFNATQKSVFNTKPPQRSHKSRNRQRGSHNLPANAWFYFMVALSFSLLGSSLKNHHSIKPERTQSCARLEYFRYPATLQQYMKTILFVNLFFFHINSFLDFTMSLVVREQTVRVDLVKQLGKIKCQFPDTVNFGHFNAPREGFDNYCQVWTMVTEFWWNSFKLNVRSI